MNLFNSTKLSQAFAIAVLGLSLSVLTGCATKIKASSVQNPAPPTAFSEYARIEVKPVVFKENYKGDYSGLAKINDNFQKDLRASLETWNNRQQNGRSLTVIPVIEELQFKHGAKRVLFGPLAGSSGVLMRLKIVDDKGNEIANPEFFQRADAWAAGFVFGVHDNLMLTRVANLASSYVIANYEKAVGGPTGADSNSLQK